jgi:hypothetical protein
VSNLKFRQIPEVQLSVPIFVGQTFHNKNQQNIVALIPSNMVAADFQYDWKLEAGKIQLLFDFTLLPHSSLPQEEPHVVECAFIRYISSFADSVNKPLFKRGEKKVLPILEILLYCPGF